MILPYQSEVGLHERPYQICTRCVMDTTDHEITFDEQGVCNHCHYVENQLKYYWHPNDRGKELLRQMVAEVKAHSKGQKYDSIIGLSGGVDSSYLACHVKEWGLNPLAVHVDAGWNSELAVKNIEQIVSIVGLDLVTHVVDWDEMKDLQLAFLKSNVANQDSPQDHAFFAALYNFAVENGIRYVISGSNYATESVLPVCWGYDPMDLKHVKAIHQQYGRKKLKTFPFVSFFNFHVYYPKVKKMTVLQPLNLMPYNKSLAIEDLENNFGWRYYGGKHYESRWTRFFQAYYLPTKFGYDKRKAHLSSIVLSGEITREAALMELERPLYTDNELADDKAFVSKKLGISVEELDALVAAPRRHYSEFPHSQVAARRVQEAMSIVRGLSRRFFGG